MSPSKQTPEHWERSSLETNDGSESALLFKHPAREEGFPQVYLLHEPHLLRPPDFSPARYPRSNRSSFHDYVITVRKDFKFMEQWKETGAKTGTPSDDVPLNLENGWLKLEEGDMVWARDLDGTKKPEDDVIRFYYIGPGVIDPADQSDMHALAERTLGPTNLRSPEASSIKGDGAYEGGTTFERSSRAKCVKPGARCYTTAYSYQMAPRIASVTAGSKRLGGDSDNLDLRAAVNLTFPTIAADYCQKTAPQGFCSILQNYGDALNTPSIGKSLQHLFTNVQVNISPAAATAVHDSSTFNSSLGEFAVPHVDKNDAAAALTAMVLLLSVPEDYDAGVFAYHDFKLFIKPASPSIVYFTGLHRHGGTAPFPLPFRQPVPWAYRLTIICYPNAPTMEGQSRNPLVPFRGFDIVVKKANDDNNREDVLKIPPEVRFRERPDCNKANLARDGRSVQGPQALLTSYSREAALIVDHLFAMFRPQFPDHDINVDYSAIYNAISMTPGATNEEDNSGESAAIRPIPWEHGPAADGSTEEFAKCMDECKKYMHFFAMHTPQYFLLHKSNSAPGIDSDEEEEPYSHHGAQSLIADGAPEATNTGKKKFATNKPKGATIVKRKGSARNGGETKGKKRKVHEESERGSVADEMETGEPQGKRLRFDNQPQALAQGSGSRGGEPEISFKILEGLDCLAIAQELNTFQNSVDHRISKGPLSREALLSAFTSNDPRNLEISTIPSTWTSLSSLDQDIEIQPAGCRVLTALSLKTHSDMWTWFSWHVTEPVLYLLATPIERHKDDGVQNRMPNTWIFRLFQRVQILLLLHKGVHLAAADFFEGLDAPSYESPYGLDHNILPHVEGAVTLWLQFHPRPGISLPTSRAVATFISTASAAFGSTDFLYLSYIQDRIKTLRASLTDQKIHLMKIPWDRLAKKLKAHPLGNPSSSESIAVKRLKEMLVVVSGLGDPIPIPQEMAAQYKISVEMGGDKGVAAFTDFAALPLPMRVSISSTYRLSAITTPRQVARSRNS